VYFNEVILGKFNLKRASVSVAQVSFSGLFGGREAVACSLAGLLSSHVRTSLLYLIIENRTSEQKREEMLKKIELFDLSRRLFAIDKRFSMKIVEEIAQAIDEDGIRILHCHCYKSVIFAWLARVKAKQKPRIVFTLHGLPVSLSLRSIPVYLAHLASLFAADSIVGCCAARTDLLRRIPVLRRKVSVIQNALMKTASDTCCDHQSGRAVAAQPVRIGFVGRLSTEKNIPLLLHAMQHLKKTAGNPHSFECIIAGEGELLEMLKSLAKELNICEMVTFAGFVRNTDELYRSLDILVLTSDYEGIPMCILEGMSHGLPVVASAVGGIVEMIRDGVDGILFPKGDLDRLVSSLTELIADPEKRLKVGKNGYRRFLTDFTPEMWRDKHLRHYLSLLENA